MRAGIRLAFVSVLLATVVLLLFVGTVRAAGGLGALQTLRGAGDTAHLFEWNGSLPLVYVLGVMVAITLVAERRPPLQWRCRRLQSPGCRCRSARRADPGRRR